MMRMAHDLVVLEFTPCPHLSRPPAPFSPIPPLVPPYCSILPALASLRLLKLRDQTIYIELCFPMSIYNYILPSITLPSPPMLFIRIMQSPLLTLFSKRIPTISVPTLIVRKMRQR
jgi:hypothetical protein